MAPKAIISNPESKLFLDSDLFWDVGWYLRQTSFPQGFGLRARLVLPMNLPPDGAQMAKSVYSGFTASVGADNMPAATVALVPCSIRTNEPVNRLVV